MSVIKLFNGKNTEEVKLYPSVAEAGGKAVKVTADGKDWYAGLGPVDDKDASSGRLMVGGTTYALLKECAAKSLAVGSVSYQIDSPSYSQCRIRNGTLDMSYSKGIYRQNYAHACCRADNGDVTFTIYISNPKYCRCSMVNNEYDIYGDRKLYNGNTFTLHSGQEQWLVFAINNAWSQAAVWHNP